MSILISSQNLTLCDRRVFDADRYLYWQNHGEWREYDAPRDGIERYPLEQPEALAPALERALAAGRPACVNVMTDPEVVAPATSAMYGQPRPARDESGGEKAVRVPYYADLEPD